MRSALVAGFLTLARLGAGQEAAPKPHFEVASIRPFTPRPGSGGFTSLENPEHLAVATDLRFLILRAYGLETYQVIGPDSLATGWTVAANAAAGTTREQQNRMLQSLIEERFHLTFHHEMKEFKVYNLVIAKGGLKLKESIPTEGCAMGATSVQGKECGPATRPVGIAKAVGEGRWYMTTSPKGVLAARNLTLFDFARSLRGQAGEVVIDKTGLEGVYDVRMEYSIVDIRTGRPFDDSPGPALADALQQQLGLKLEAAKAMIETMVIDHVDATPSDN